MDIRAMWFIEAASLSQLSQQGAQPHGVAPSRYEVERAAYIERRAWRLHHEQRGKRARLNSDRISRAGIRVARTVETLARSWRQRLEKKLGSVEIPPDVRQGSPAAG